MESIFVIAALWLGLAVISSVIAYHIRVSLALIEICVGVLAAAVSGYLGKADALGSNLEWPRFLAASGAVLLTFLAGAELEPQVIRKKMKEVTVVGRVGFFAPFLGCAAVARYILEWNTQASLLCGVALSTTSMAVVYAVMLETGFNRTDFGKGILGACFINDLGTVIALGLLFAPFCVAVFNLPVYTVAGAALMGTFLTSIAGVFLYSVIPAAGGMSTRPDWLLGLLFGAGGFAGMYCGARLQKFVPQQFINLMLGLIITFLAVRYILQFFL
ncbi:MAG: cation:proton antiporter [Deltaproteobacteria bacterium]|nr:cation:proton antiporter [Deltaproteobacteria bacterium]